MKKIILIFLFVSQLCSAQTAQVNKLSDIKNKNANGDLTDQIIVQGVYLRNLGNLGDLYKDAVGVMVSYGKHFPNSFLLVGTTGFMNHNLRVDTTQAIFQTVPLYVGGRYYLRNKSIMPYFSFMNGLNIIQQDKNTDLEPDRQTLFRYFMQVGFGLDFKISNPIIFNINMNYNNAFYNPYYMLTGFQYAAGISLMMK